MTQASIEKYKQLLGSRLEEISAQKSLDARKAAWASFVSCRKSNTQPSSLVKQPAQLFNSHAAPFFWLLLDDWINTGFDQVLLKMLSTKPEERPKPSEILEATWFKKEIEIPEEGNRVEFTCPDYPISELRVMFYTWCATLGLSLLTFCICIGGACCTLIKDVPAWKWSMPWGGLMVIAAPISEFYVLDPIPAYVFLLLMFPLGLILLMAPCEIKALKERKLLLVQISAAICAMLLAAHQWAIAFMAGYPKDAAGQVLIGLVNLPWAVFQAFLTISGLPCFYGLGCLVIAMLSSWMPAGTQTASEPVVELQSVPA